MRLLGALLAFCSIVTAVEPPAKDQAAMQDALRRYLVAVNDCDEAAVRAVVTKDFSVQGHNMKPEFVARLRPRAEVCEANKGTFEVTALARVLRVATPEVTVADGYFRTIQLPGGDHAGRLYLTFVRREERWQLMSLRFHNLRFEAPYLGIEPAAKHDPAGADGWVTLFDGRSTEALREVGGGPFPSTWKVADGLLQTVPGKNGRSLQTRDTFRSFELRFEWKAAVKGNSGIKYHLFFLMKGDQGTDGIGHEYQIADDGGDPGAIQFPVERSGALYNQIAPRGAVLKPLGEFNESRIVVQGRHREHWLNGVKVVEYESESGPPEGPLTIQHHETSMALRNIRLRRITP